MPSGTCVPSPRQRPTREIDLVTSPPFAIPREERILQTSYKVRHAVWTMILIGHGTHTAQASAILAQETSVSTTSELPALSQKD